MRSTSQSTQKYNSQHRDIADITNISNIKYIGKIIRLAFFNALCYHQKIIFLGIFQNGHTIITRRNSNNFP